MKSNRLDHIRVVLVEPKQPGNIGAVARAMKNTGLSRLYLVNPADHTCGDARAMAHGSGDILYGATVVSSLAEALEGVTLSVGTSHRKRREFDVLYGPRTTSEKLLALPDGDDGALVFGREENGLTNDELQICQIVSRAPSAVQYPSFNLSQATLVYGYELFVAAQNPPETTTLDLASRQEIEMMYAHIHGTMGKIGFTSRHPPQRFMRSVRRIFGRIELEVRDTATIHRIFRQIDRFITRHDLDPDPDAVPYNKRTKSGICSADHEIIQNSEEAQ